MGASVGTLPSEYNHKVHGPYNPGTYYGKPDPLGQVKIGEVGSWIGRRNISPSGVVRSVNRAHWRWLQTYFLTKKGGSAGIAQFTVLLSMAYYFLQYRSHTNHRHAKYH
ncbi:putative ATP synthase subunit f, mitochondrial [Argonauta hians]